MIKDFKNKVAVVTGGAQGIGLAVVRRFLDEGMRVVVADIDDDAMAEAERTLDAGSRLHTIHCDVGSLEANQELADETARVFGGVNLAHFNAAVLGDIGGWKASDITPESWRRNLEVSLNGPFYGMKVFLPLLEEQEEAHAVFTASTFSLIPSLGDPAPYFVAKAGLLALAECLYHDLEDTGSHIGVTAILPGNTYNSSYYYLVDLLAQTEDDPSGWDEGSFGDRETTARLIGHFTTHGTGPEVLADDLIEALRENRFYVMPNVGGHWKYIEERWARIRDGRNPSLLDKGPDVYLDV